MSDMMLGRHDEAIRLILEEMRAVRGDIVEIKDYMAQRRGERRVGTWLLMTGSATMGSVLAFSLRYLSHVMGLSGP